MIISHYKLNQDWIQAMDVEDLAIKTADTRTTKRASSAREDVKLASVADSRASFKATPANAKTTEVNKPASTSTNSSSIAARALADKATTLAELKESLISFNGCELKKAAINTVFGDGNPSSSIMFIGEAPGASEDASGIPFCGDSGKLLDNMLKSIGLRREENFYITNTVFWRPPANRPPTSEEIDICRPFVEKHIALIKPKLLVLVGSTAITSLLGPGLQISKIRQEYYSYSNKYLETPITTTALFHPAYLLRQPGQKKTSWYDLLKIRDYMRSALKLI